MMKTHNNGKPRRTAALLAAFLCAALCAVTVYGAVTYDSSKDPVVAQSYMVQYVGEQIAAVNETLNNLTSRVEVIEITGGGGGGTSGGGSGISTEAVAQILSRINTLESNLNALQAENAELRSQLQSSRNELNSLISDLYDQTSAITDVLTSLNNSIASLTSQVQTSKSDISTLKNDFKQISDISVKLSRVSTLVDQLTKDGGDVPVLQNEVASLKAAYQNLLEEMGQTYKVVEVPAGSTIRPKDPEDTLLLILRSGMATVVSPYNTDGLRQGLNDLSDGIEIFDGETVPIYHSILIPRGGNDGRCVRIEGVTGIDTAFVMIGGDYVIES